MIDLYNQSVVELVSAVELAACEGSVSVCFAGITIAQICQAGLKGR